MREDWIECTLDDLLVLKNGFAFKSSKYINDGIPVIRIGDINDWIVDETHAKCIAENKEYDNYIVENGDILIAMSGATTGKFGIYESVNKAYQNQRVGNLKPHSKNLIDKKYIFNLLYSLKYQIEKEAYGGAQPNISAGKIHAMRTLLAPLPEQRAIVAKIEELFSDLDKGIADLNLAKDQLAIFRQAVLKKAFEGELTKVWRENQINLPTAEELLEQIKEERERFYNQQLEDWKKAVIEWEKNGKKESKPSKPQNLVSYPDIEQNKYLPILNLGELVSQISIKLMPDDAPEMPFIGMDCIEKNALKPHFTYKFNEFKSAGNWFNINHILYGRMRPYLNKVYHAEYEGVASGEFIVLETTESILPEYLKLILHQQDFVHWSNRQSSGDKPRVKFEQIALYNIIVPTVQEQHQIVKEIESRLSVCDKVEQSILESLEKAKALRQSILKKAFEGKLLSAAEIERCKQEEDYEPASVLLEKIKKEKKK
jgi:type I restriction enzyme S subunit